MGLSEKEYYNESETDEDHSDDSQEDPTFDVLEETRLTFSNLSLRRKIKTQIVKGKDKKEEEESDVIKMVLPELDEKDQKSYRTIQKIIEVGQVERLKVEECKIYLRKHVLRLSGNKETLIQRIKEHIDISNGGGEEKYPASSFVLNCKGDACMGDVVMFEQNVYEVFNIASRSASGPPCGTRVVVGRIVKESYGAAKQQHTFTIEVLWSKGEKPLPPLHPLLIKGRNLYRLKTMRQKWEDEGERQKILSEKHARGDVARLNKEARIQQREMRKMHKRRRAKGNEQPNIKQEEGKRGPLQFVSSQPEKLINQPKQQQQQQDAERKIPIQQENLHEKPNNNISNAHVLERQSLSSVNFSFQRAQNTSSPYSNFDTSKNPIRGHSYSNFSSSNLPKSPLRYASKENWSCTSMRSPPRGFGYNNIQGWPGMSSNGYLQQNYAYHGQNSNAARGLPGEEKDCEQKQKCRYYAQGRCYFGERCKYLHELAGNKL